MTYSGLVARDFSPENHTSLGIQNNALPINLQWKYRPAADQRSFDQRNFIFLSRENPSQEIPKEGPLQGDAQGATAAGPGIRIFNGFRTH